MQKLNRGAYEQLVEEDIAWLEKQPPAPERDHLVLIARCSVDNELPLLGESAVALILDDEGRLVAVSNRKYGGLGLPGGKCEGGESPRRCLVRELREELGVEVGEGDLTLVWRAPWEGDDRLVSMFHVRGYTGEIRQVEEGTVPRWARLRDVIADSVFAGWLCAMLPDDIWHLRPTHRRS